MLSPRVAVERARQKGRQGGFWCVRNALLLAAALCCLPASGIVLWSDLGPTLAHETGTGTDILGGALKRDDTSADALYFKFHIDPLSDVSTEEYFAAFQLFESDTERIGFGNSAKAWAYSAFNTAETGEFNKVFGDIDLRSARPESSAPGVFLPYELPRRGLESTLVFKVQYVPGGDDLVTVWLNPYLGTGATAEEQSTNLVTRFRANASFDQIRLRQSGGGGGWTFSDMEIATAFTDFVTGSGPDGSSRNATPVTFRSWHREQGLPQDSVRALAQTRDGYIWIGHDDGVTRFDGVRFVSFGSREGLRAGSVRRLLADTRGILWIGTRAAGLTCLQDGKFATLTVNEGLPSDSITALAEDDQGRLWIGTDAGLAIWDAGKLSAYDPAKELKGKAVTSLCKGKGGKVWACVPGAGVLEVAYGPPATGNLVRLVEPSLNALLRNPHSILLDTQGRLWVGAGEDFILCREGGQWRRYRIGRHLANPYVTSLVESPDGAVWAGSVAEGLFQFKGGKLIRVNASSGLSDNFVQALLVDSEANVWAGTGAGLNRLRRREIGVLGAPEGLGYGAVRGLAEVRPGVVWVAKSREGLFQWNGHIFERMQTAEGASYHPDPIVLLSSRQDACWIGGARGVIRLTGISAGVPQAESRMIEGLNATALFKDQAQTLWVGTQDGNLWTIREKETQKQPLESPHPVSAIAREANGRVWVGTAGAGLLRSSGDGSRRYERFPGLLADMIRCLYLDGENVLWVGTAGGGLTRVVLEGPPKAAETREAATQLTTLTDREGLPDNTVSQILEDNAGQLWLGGNRGIACLQKTAVQEVAQRKRSSVLPRLFTRADGMLSEECSGGFSPSVLKTESGQLWFPTLKGIVVVDPRVVAASPPPPRLVLEEVLIDGMPTGLQAPLSDLRVAPGKKRLEFQYTGLSFVAPERVRFRYRLEGLDPDWVDAGTRRTAFYGYVPPGQYRFRVSACNTEGVWNEESAVLALTVVPQFWQSRVFRVGVVLAALVSAAVGARSYENRRNRRRLRKLEQERTLERERARIAQDLHDELGSSLTRMSLLSDLVQADKDHPQQVAAHATRISQSAQQTVRALEEIVWALRPGSDTLQSLIEYIAHFASEMFQDNETSCRLDLPNDLPTLPLPPELRHNIFLVVKESLTNTLKHAQATEVRVQALAVGGALEITLEDNGRGFSPPLEGVESRRNGLGNMRRRAESIGGTLALESVAGKGTKVRLRVLLPGWPGS